MSGFVFHSPYLDTRQIGRGNGGNEADTILHRRNVFKQTIPMTNDNCTDFIFTFLFICLAGNSC